HVTSGAASMLSVAVAVKVMTWSSETMSAGSVSTGGVVSVTTTRNDPVVVAVPFVAEQETVVDPIGKNAPEPGEQAAVPTSNVTLPPFAEVASPTTTSGRFSCGGGSSCGRSTMS